MNGGLPKTLYPDNIVHPYLEAGVLLFTSLRWRINDCHFDNPQWQFYKPLCVLVLMANLPSVFRRLTKTSCFLSGLSKSPSPITLNKLYFHLGTHCSSWKITIPLRTLTLANKVSFNSFSTTFLSRDYLLTCQHRTDSMGRRLSCFPLSTSTHCSSPRPLSTFMKALGILFEPTRIGNERAEHSWSSPSPSPTMHSCLVPCFERMSSSNIYEWVEHAASHIDPLPFVRPSKLVIISIVH